MKQNKSRIFTLSAFIVLFSAIIILSGCATMGSTPKKYYTGYDSVNMKFMDEAPPLIFYYDGQAANPYINTVPVQVMVENKGSSDSYGALFIHGFDPNIVAVDGYTRAFGNIPLRGMPYSGANGLSFMVPGTAISFGLSNYGGGTHINFGTFLGGGDTSRSSLFAGLGLTIGSDGKLKNLQANVVNSRVGSILRPITQGMFSSIGWSGGWLKVFDMEGRNPDNPNGDVEVIEFPATITYLPPSSEQFIQRIMVTSCFDYATHASAMVCVDPQPYSNVLKACKPLTVSAGSGQGAPVAITTIEQKPSRGKTVFTINVHHTKKEMYDDLYDYFSLYKCDPASGEMVKATDKNIVYVGYVFLSNEDITMNCIPDQIIRLDESGNGQIMCTAAIPEGVSAYQAPLEIELWYGYSKSIYRDVIIKRI